MDRCPHRRPEPFGPVMRGRAALLRERGLIAPDADSEELVVVEARAQPTAPAATTSARRPEQAPRAKADCAR